MPLHICACVFLASLIVFAGGISLSVISAKSKNKYKWLGVILGISLVVISILMMLSSGRQISRHMSSTPVTTVIEPPDLLR